MVHRQLPQTPFASFLLIYILPHIAKQNYILLFFSFPPFRGLATKCGSAMLKPKGVSDCVPKCLLLVTLWKGKPRYKFLGAKHKAVRHWQGKYLRHAIRLSILSTVLYYKYSDTSKQHASNQHLHNNTSTDNWKSLFFYGGQFTEFTKYLFDIYVQTCFEHPFEHHQV